MIFPRWLGHLREAASVPLCQELMTDPFETGPNPFTPPFEGVSHQFLTGDCELTLRTDDPLPYPRVSCLDDIPGLC
jgi:hypothetical protein